MRTRQIIRIMLFMRLVCWSQTEVLDIVVTARQL